MILLLIILFLLFAIWFFNTNVFKNESEYIPTEYELKTIEYFKTIALKSEYFDDPQKVTKWRKKMSLYIFKESDLKNQDELLIATINKINSIASDGFKIELVEDYKQANAFLYFCKKNSLKKIAPNFHSLLNETVKEEYSGFSYVEYKLTNFVITKALIFIDSESTPSELNHSIVEELTQSIGLLNDSDTYPNSIFYEGDDNKNTEGIEFSQMDIDLISFLYNPNMKPGYSDRTAEQAIKNILKKRRKN